MDFSKRQIWKITYPVLISLLMQDLIGLTDTAFMGRVGEVELGASALGGIFYMVIYMLGFGFSVGAEILMGRRNGEGRYSGIGAVFFHGSLILFLAAVVLFIAGTVFSPQILRGIIASDDVYEATVSYTRWRMAGLLFSFVAIMFRAFYMSVTNTRVMTINGLVMLVSNVGLNYVLIFGKLGMPAMGIAGAALGSTIAEAISMSFYILYTRSRKDHAKYGLFRLRKINFSLVRSIGKLSGWTTVQYFMSSATWLFFFLAIEHLGERPLAISNMVRNVSMIGYLFVSAFGYTGSAMVSNLMGAGRQERVIPLVRRIILMCFTLLLPVVVVVMLAPSIALRLFTDDPSLIAATLPSLYVMLSSYVLTVPAYIVFLAVSGTGNTKAGFWIEVAAMVAYVVFIYNVAVVARADIAICWLSEWVYNIVLLTICVIWFRRSRWRQRVI